MLDLYIRSSKRSNCGSLVSWSKCDLNISVLEVSRGTVSKFMTAYTQCSKTNSSNQNSGRKEKLSERDRRVLKRIVTSKMLTTTAKVTAELYQHLDSPVSIITIRMDLHKQNIYGAVWLFPSHLSQMLMPHVVYSGVTLTKPGRLINGRK
ncbi:hypothetical protein TNCV_3290841 [Trichonephila clavipes]|nr:hypothetical protein TNCV_3290841 [Trichonephila clavipes]